MQVQTPSEARFAHNFFPQHCTITCKEPRKRPSCMMDRICNNLYHNCLCKINMSKNLIEKNKKVYYVLPEKESTVKSDIT